MKKIIVKGYPRIHFSLIDMSAASNRMYGGCGIAIKAFPVTVEILPSEKIEIETSGHISERTVRNLKRALKNANDVNLPTNCKVRVHSAARQHIGLGSSTQIILTALDAISSFHNWGISPEMIIDISGRGRTSMIGFGTHYYGGFCIDAGQKHNANMPFLPSHSPEDRKPSLYIGNWNFPNSWLISLIGVKSPIAMPTDEESDFMRNNTPMHRMSGLETIATLYHGILPAIITEDYSAFMNALKRISLVGWTSIELRLQSKNTLNMIEELWSNGIAACLSSFGPIIAVIHTNDKITQVKSLAAKNNLSYSGPYQAIPKHS